MIKNVEATIREYIKDIIHMSLATTVNNKPWVCEVHFAYDANLNLYFMSLPTRRHSLEISQNPNVSGNIIVQHTEGQKPRGVYFEGTAELLKNVTNEDPAYKALSERFGRGEEMLEDATKDDGHKFYKITVSKYYLFDSRESSPSTKYELDWKK